MEGSLDLISVGLEDILPDLVRRRGDVPHVLPAVGEEFWISSVRLAPLRGPVGQSDHQELGQLAGRPCDPAGRRLDYLSGALGPTTLEEERRNNTYVKFKIKEAKGADLGAVA